MHAVVKTTLYNGKTHAEKNSIQIGVLLYLYYLCYVFSFMEHDLFSKNVYLLVYLTGTMQYNIATISSSRCSTYRLLAKG